MKKIISLLILVSMTLHCFSRLEVISYVYSHRHDLSFALGLTAERVISVCRGDYFQGQQLGMTMEQDDTDTSSLPQAQEILLSIPTPLFHLAGPGFVVLSGHPAVMVAPVSQAASSEIFHPPLV